MREMGQDDKTGSQRSSEKTPEENFSVEKRVPFMETEIKCVYKTLFNNYFFALYKTYFYWI